MTLTPEPCNCESSNCNHPYLGVPSGEIRVAYLGKVCDECAATHMTEYVTPKLTAVGSERIEQDRKLWNIASARFPEDAESAERFYDHLRAISVRGEPTTDIETLARQFVRAWSDR